MKRRFLLFGLSASLISSPLFALRAATNDVWVVDDDAPADFAAIQPAVDVAAPGDLILVKPGVYEGFQVVGKPLSIVGDAVAPVPVDGLVRLRDLPAGDGLSLAGLQLLRGLRVHDCIGEVRLADCTLDPQGLCYTQAFLGMHRIVNCASVVLTRSTFHGRTGGAMLHDECDTWDGLVGETGLSVTSSRVALYSCFVQGGEGGEGEDGQCLFCIDGYPGDGGTGLVGESGSKIYADDCVFLGGEGSPDPLGCESDRYTAEDGAPVFLVAPSTLATASDPVLALESSTLVREDEQLPLVLHGPPGSVAWLIWSDAADWRPFVGADFGFLHCASAGWVLQPLGALSGAGVLNASFTPPAIFAGRDVRRLSIQAFAVAPGVGRIVGTPSSLDVVDPVF